MCSWIKEATIKKAKKSKFPKFRHAALITKGGRIVSTGVNITKPKTPDSSFSTHAEIVSLKRLITVLTRQKNKDTFEIYVARVDMTNTPAFSKPCVKCLEALKESRLIDVIHYTTKTGWESVKTPSS